jgi:DnaJ-domain-containing protein 1
MTHRARPFPEEKVSTRGMRAGPLAYTVRAMGLLDNMFGGGTKLDLYLDNTTASAGAVIGGRVVLTGGQKPYRITELAVRLMYVHTETKPGETLPSIDLRELTKQVVAANAALPPGAQQQFTFRVTVPHGTQITAHNVSYQLVATADIPGIKDPQGSAKVDVVDASDDDNRRLPLEEIVSRFPNLRSQNEEQVCDALYDFFLACYSEGAQLMEAEQLIAWHMQNGTVKTRRKALEAWANLVDNRVTPQHLQTLYGIANLPGLDGDTFEQVIIASTKFAEEGTLPLVQQFAQHAESRVRAQVASNLRFNSADRFQGKRELLVQLAQDPAPDVRKGAVSALSDFRDDQQMMYWVANLADSDPDPEVQAECISTLGLVHYHGMGDLALQVYDKHVSTNPSSKVREEIARSLSSQPKEQLQRVWAIAQKLAADQDEDVRSAMAFQFCNMSDMPQLLPIAQHMAQNDQSAEVRRRALESMSSLMQPQQAAQLYGGMMQQARTEDDLWPVLNGLRTHREHGMVKQLLTQLGQCQYPNVADAAREALS